MFNIDLPFLFSPVPATTAERKIRILVTLILCAASDTGTLSFSVCV